MNEDIKKSMDVLYAGGLILFPTDTTWGIGCDATNEEAVRKIYELKQQLDNTTITILLDSAAKLNFYIDNVPDIAWDLIEITDKPLTIIYHNARNIAPNLIADDGSIGIRITQEKFSNELCKRFRKAIVFTSANTNGGPPPRNFSEINDYIKENTGYTVQYGQNDLSTERLPGIIKLSANGEIKIIRE